MTNVAQSDKGCAHPIGCSLRERIERGRFPQMTKPTEDRPETQIDLDRMGVQGQASEKDSERRPKTVPSTENLAQREEVDPVSGSEPDRSPQARQAGIPIPSLPRQQQSIQVQQRRLIGLLPELVVAQRFGPVQNVRSVVELSVFPMAARIAHAPSLLPFGLRRLR
jgi:hypothetical protein